MKILNWNSRTTAIAGFLLLVPAAYFMLISILKFELGSPYLYDLSWPTLKSLGIEGKLGFNINLLIAFGPVLAFLLNVLSVLHISFETTKDTISCQASVKKTPINLAALILSALVFLVLMGYAVLENFPCHCG